VGRAAQHERLRPEDHWHPQRDLIGASDEAVDRRAERFTLDLAAHVNLGLVRRGAAARAGRVRPRLRGVREGFAGTDWRYEQVRRARGEKHEPRAKQQAKPPERRRPARHYFPASSRARSRRLVTAETSRSSRSPDNARSNAVAASRY